MLNLKTLVGAGAAFAASAVMALAGPLQDRIDAGESIRIGFANEVPWAYPGENNAPLGFVNAHVLGVLGEMGYDNIEPVVTDWGGLIPGPQGGPFRHHHGRHVHPERALRERRLFRADGQSG